MIIKLLKLLIILMNFYVLWEPSNYWNCVCSIIIVIQDMLNLIFTMLEIWQFLFSVVFLNTSLGYFVMSVNTEIFTSVCLWISIYIYISLYLNSQVSLFPECG